MVLFFLALQIPFFLRPISGYHAWRQADTASVTKNFFEEDPNLLFPRIDIREDKTGITGMEFPLYQYTLHLVYRVFRTPLESLSIVLNLICLFLLWHLMPKLLSLNDPLQLQIFRLIFLCSPMIFLWTGKFMPEIFGLTLTIAGNFCFQKNSNSNNQRHLILGAVFSALGCLIRPFFIFWNLFLLLQFFESCKKKLFKEALTRLLAGLSIITVFSLWYFYWVPRLNQVYGITYFFMGSDLGTTINQILSWHFPLHLWRNLFSLQLGPAFAGFAILAISNPKTWNSTDKTILGVLFLTLTILPLLIGTHFDNHIYYLMGTAPALTYFAAKGFAQTSSKQTKGIIILIGLLQGFVFSYLVNDQSKILFMTFLFPIVVYSALQLRVKFLSRIPASLFVLFMTAPSALVIYQMGPKVIKRKASRIASERIYQEIQTRVPKSDRIAITDVDRSLPFYLLDRKGWPVPTEKMQNLEYFQKLQTKGVKWVLQFQADQKKFALHKIQDYIESLSP